MRTLIHLSGGQDSTYCLWKWLSENPTELILVHHVAMHSRRENREQMEDHAVNSILEWLRSNDLANFIYHKSHFSYGTLPWISVKDIQIMAFFSSCIIRQKNLSIDKIIMPWHKGEVHFDEQQKGHRVKALLAAMEITKSIELIFPIENMTRAEMAAEMPEELLALCWSCRKPRSNQKCGKCRACLESKEAGIFKTISTKLG
jgi:7-cyano-7-deazaguanine synthase in queuosine biosynthesis